MGPSLIWNPSSTHNCVPYMLRYDMNLMLEYVLLPRRQEQTRDREKRLRQLLGDVQSLPAIDDAPLMLRTPRRSKEKSPWLLPFLSTER